MSTICHLNRRRHGAFNQNKQSLCWNPTTSWQGWTALSACFGRPKVSARIFLLHLCFPFHCFHLQALRTQNMSLETQTKQNLTIEGWAGDGSSETCSWCWWVWWSSWLALHLGDTSGLVQRTLTWEKDSLWTSHELWSQTKNRKGYRNN